MPCLPSHRICLGACPRGRVFLLYALRDRSVYVDFAHGVCGAPGPCTAYVPGPRQFVHVFGGMGQRSRGCWLPVLLFQAGRLVLPVEHYLSLYLCRCSFFLLHVSTQISLARVCMLLQVCQKWKYELFKLSLKCLDSKVVSTLVLNRCKSRVNSAEGRVMQHKTTVHVCEQIQLTVGEIKIMK